MTKVQVLQSNKRAHCIQVFGCHHATPAQSEASQGRQAQQEFCSVAFIIPALGQVQAGQTAEILKNFDNSCGNRIAAAPSLTLKS